MFFDPLYLLFVLPGLILALMASAYTRSTFAKYSRVGCSSRMSGAEAAARMLAASGVSGVKIEQTSGFLSDHYDPTSKTLRLSREVYSGRTLSAVGVACHEAGHALQHAQNYTPLAFRSTMVPIVNFASPLSYILIIAGVMLQAQPLAMLGVILFASTVLFALITLPVEFNASQRARKMLSAAGIVTPGEASQAGEVLNAAFLTYVAAAVNALLILIYYIIRARE